MNRRRVFGVAILETLLLAVLAACGGSSGGSSGTNVASAPRPNCCEPAGNGTVVVIGRDVFGNPIRGATIRFVSNGGYEDLRESDATGRATFTGLAKGTVSAVVHADDESVGRVWGHSEGDLLANGRLEIEVVARPNTTAPLYGVAPAIVERDDVSADGRSLEFRLSLMQVSGSYDWGGLDVSLEPCVPDASNDQPTFHADCIGGASGFDRAYAVVESMSSTRATFDKGGTPHPYTATLLLDQSRRVGDSDPWDRRLFGVKYLITRLESDSLLLAAFATDNASTGERAQLTDRPVTVISTNADASLFPAVDELATLEGGASPLYAAIDEMLDVVAKAPPVPGQSRSIVVLTDGHDDACGTADICRAARQLVTNKSNAAGIEIVTVALPGGSADDRRGLTELTAANLGRAFWMDDADNALLLGELPSILSDRIERAELRFRIEADAVGTFASGRTVYATLELEVCPWDCSIETVPIAVLIP